MIVDDGDRSSPDSLAYLSGRWGARLPTQRVGMIDFEEAVATASHVCSVAD